MKKILSIIAFLILTAGITPVPARASQTCQPIYGGGQNCQENPAITINKLVQQPNGGSFVNNLGVNDAKYTAGQNVTFRIIVTNPSTNDLTNVPVTDVFPNYVTFVSGPGNFNNDNKTLTFTIDTLKAGESKSYDVVTQVVSNNNLPNNEGVVCVTNHAEATAEGNTANANAQFCIEKPTLGTTTSTPTTTSTGITIFPAQPTTTTPPTGPEAIALLGLIPSAITGFILRKKSK